MIISDMDGFISGFYTKAQESYLKYYPLQREARFVNLGAFTFSASQIEEEKIEAMSVGQSCLLTLDLKCPSRSDTIQYIRVQFPISS